MTNTTNRVNSHNGHEYVDLGLPSGTLWATCNVGATSPELPGLYFAWGEIEGFSIKQINKGEIVFDKDKYYTGPAASISKDLTFDIDAANHYMGGKWRMPTGDECQELIDNCDVMWTDDYNGTGVAGRVFTSMVNGNSMFLPTAGYCDYSSVYYVGSHGLYWSASWDSSSYAWSLIFNPVYQRVNINTRYYGFSVRGVCKRG